MTSFKKKVLTLIISIVIAAAGIPCSYSFAAANTKTGSDVFSDTHNNGAEYEEGTLLILTKKGTEKRQIKNIADDAGCEVNNVSNFGNGTKLTQVDVDEETSMEEAISEIGANEEVIAVQPNYIYRTDDESNDPQATGEAGAGRQWHLYKPELSGCSGGVDAFGAWDELSEKEPRVNKPVVAVIDSGVDYAHEDLKENILTDKCVTFADGEDEPKEFDYYDKKLDKSSGHGTHVCGLIGATTNNGTGVAGVAANYSNIICIDAEDNNEDFHTTDVCNSINYAVKNGAKIINMSLGGGGRDYVLTRCIESAWDDGVLCICAAGNEKTSDFMYPSDSPCAISVMNHKSDNTLNSSSNFGIEKDVSAPGTTMLSTVPDNGYRVQSGTSMAAPVVSGIAALLLHEDSSLTPGELKNLIYTSSGSGEYSLDKNNGGFGHVNAKNAVANLKKAKTAPQKIVLNKTDIEIYEGDNTGIEYEVLPANSNDVTAEFTSSDPNVVSVNKNGVLESKKPGKAAIKVTCGDVWSVCNVTVKSDLKGKIDHKPFKVREEIDYNDPMIPVTDGGTWFNAYMHVFEVDLVKGETIKMCAKNEIYDPDEENLFVWVRNEAGKTVSGQYSYSADYTAEETGRYKVEIITDDVVGSFDKKSYEFFFASSKATVQPYVDKETGSSISIRWNGAGDADKYIVKKYVDGQVSSSTEVTDTFYNDYEYDSKADISYTVTPVIIVDEDKEYSCGESVPAGHKWGEEKVEKEEACSENSGNVYTGQENQSGQQTEDFEQMSPDGTAIGPGASAAVAEKAITSMKNDSDPAGSSFSKLRLRSPGQAEKAVKLSWSKVPGAAKYVLYGNHCGAKNKMKKIATLKKNSLNVKKAAKKLKKGTYYKFLIVAIDKNNNVVSTSKVIHVATKGSRKAANPKKVIVKARVSKKGRKLKKYKVTSVIALRAGKTTQLKAKITKPKKGKVRKHVRLRYESANTKIAKVTSKGKVKGAKKGTTTIYVYAQNGIFKAVRVHVKQTQKKY